MVCSGWCCGCTPRRWSKATLLVEHQHAARNTLLVHVQATATGVHYLHRSLLFAAGRKTLKEKSDIPSRALSPGGGGTLLCSNKASSQIDARAISTTLYPACFAGDLFIVLPIAAVFIPRCAGVCAGMW